MSELKIVKLFRTKKHIIENFYKSIIQIVNVSLLFSFYDEILIEKFISQGMTVSEISDILNIKQSQIIELLKEKGIYKEKQDQKEFIRSLPKIEKISTIYSSDSHKNARRKKGKSK